MTRILSTPADPFAGEPSRGRTEPAADHGHGPASQCYLGLSRQLAALTGLNADATLSIGLTSAARREGVTSVSVNLAAAASRDLGGRVLLVDANFAAPAAAEAAGARRGPGLADLMLDPAMDLDACLQPSAAPNLDVLTAGAVPARQDLSVSVDRIRRVLKRLAAKYQMLIVDLPVASELTNCFAVARCLDGVLLVVEAERTRNKAVARAKKQLLQGGAEVVGVVLNKRREHVPGWLYDRV